MHVPRWIEEPPSLAGLPLHPAAAMAVVGAAVVDQTDDEIFVDIGNTMLYATHGLALDRPRLHINWTFGSMGHAVPAALGACDATGRRVWALVGDAAFAQTGMELHTASERRLPLVVVVLNNGGNGMCEVGAKMMGVQAPCAMYRRRLDAAALGRSLGARARVVRSAPQLARALAWALRVPDRPVVLDVRVDPTAAPPMGARLEVLSFEPSPAAGAGGRP
jgi:acetolactate synthase-1/2/3 large subunit